MNTGKATVDEIRHRFDQDVERFSNLETGQSATMDAPLVLDLIRQLVPATNPAARAMFDIGCGAGNFTLKILQMLPNLDCTLMDLSLPMLQRARQRVGAATTGRVTCLQTDIRDYTATPESFDVIVAAAVLHHLRAEQEWRSVFQMIYRALKPGGTFWVWDMITHDTPAVQTIMQQSFGQYLSAQKGTDYRDAVFTYIEKEDSPTSLNFQLNMLRQTGFQTTEILHKTAVFAAYVAIK